MGVYRIEVASSGRAICKNTECKKNQIKIPKGELRFCTQVDINGKQSWTFKHWGCTTPQQIQNLKNSIEDNIDYLDGFDELPSDLQAKVLKTLEEGHVDDAEWKGDLAQNRPGMTKFRSPAGKKAKPTGKADEDEHGNHTSSQPPPKKRGRAKKEKIIEDDEQNERPIKKPKHASRNKSNNPKEIQGGSETELPPPPKRQGKGKKADAKLDSERLARQEEINSPFGEPEPQPKQKRPQRRAAAFYKAIDDQSGDERESDMSNEQGEDVEVEPTQSRKKAAKASSGPKSTASKKSTKVGSANAKASDDSEKPAKSTQRASRKKVA